MPLPKKQPGESSNEFIDRCMSDSETKREFPDSKVRIAVCNRLAGNPPPKASQSLGDWHPKCAARHLGFWMVEPVWFQAAVESVKNGSWPIKMFDEKQDRKEEEPQPLFNLVKGVAIITLQDFLTKGESKFGGTSTVMTRMAIREAIMDPDVNAIMLSIDSPGGTASGTKELADDVARAEMIMPVVTQVTDLMASAALWIGVQASQVVANATAEIGSIGTVVAVEDSSKAADMQGVKVHVISTGEFKGAFASGTKVTKAQLDDVQERVDDINSFFLDGVATGRRMSMQSLAKIADGRMFIASKALDLGLIDAIQSPDATFAQLVELSSDKDKKRKRMSAEARIRVAKG